MAGVTLNVLYTYSKSIDECDADGACLGVDFYNRRLEKAPAGFNIKHHFQNLLTYEFPVGNGRRFLNRGGLLNAIVGGWNFTSTWTVQSGLPFSATYAGGPNKYLPGGGVSRPNVLVPFFQAQVQNYNIGPNRFPTSAQNPYLLFNDFAYPAPYTAGNLGRNTFTGPFMNWVQLGLSKTWAFRERVKFTMRIEGDDWPFKTPGLELPNAVYNVNNANLFGTFTTLYPPFAGAGQSRPQIIVGSRAEF
jgi:hypothetical protein